MGVEVLESGFVGPSEETPKHAVWLSNLDLVFSTHYTPQISVYRPAGGPGCFSPEALRAALSKALVPYYPLAGRLVVGRDGRLEINCTGEGVLFVVARSDSTLDDFGVFEPSPEIQQLLVPSVERPGNPPCILLMLQITFFECGGVCLGVALQHSATDGMGILQFINSWSDITRGAEVSITPSIDRTLIRARSPPVVCFEHTEYARKPHAKAPSNKTPSETTIIKLSKDQVSYLKNRASSKKALSTFSVITTHLWRCACIARRLKPDQETQLLMTFDARDRLRPPLPPGYLGNAVFRKSVTVSAGEISLNPLELGVERINGAIVQADDMYVRSLIDFLELQEDVGSFGSLVLSPNDLRVISWQQLPIYGADFGGGKPVYMGRAAVRGGFAYILRSPEGNGGINLVVGLEAENMSRFKKLFNELLDLETSMGRGG